MGKFGSRNWGKERESKKWGERVGKNERVSLWGERRLEKNINSTSKKLSFKTRQTRIKSIYVLVILGLCMVFAS